MRSAILAEMSSKMPGAAMSSGRLSRAASFCRFSRFTIAYLQGNEQRADHGGREVDEAGLRERIGWNEEHEAAHGEERALERRELAQEKAADRRGGEPHAGDGGGDRRGHVEGLAGEEQRRRDDKQE